MTLIKPIQTEIYCNVSLIERSCAYIIINNNIILYICNYVINEKLKFVHETDKVDMHIIKMLNVNVNISFNFCLLVRN